MAIFQWLFCYLANVRPCVELGLCYIKNVNFTKKVQIKQGNALIRFRTYIPYGDIYIFLILNIENSCVVALSLLF